MHFFKKLDQACAKTSLKRFKVVRVSQRFKRRRSPGDSDPRSRLPLTIVNTDIWRSNWRRKPWGIYCELHTWHGLRKAVLIGSLDTQRVSAKYVPRLQD